MTSPSNSGSPTNEPSALTSGTFRVEEDTSGEKVTASPAGSSLESLAKLVGSMAGPYALVYVLHECYTFRPEGRYQAPQPLSAKALGDFLTRFADFFEEDGRHGLFVLSGSEPCAVGLDRNGMVTAYGEKGRWPPVMRSLAFSEGIVSPRPRRPRVPEHDASEAQLLAAMPWQWNSLELSDLDLP